jgi:hypothetical protein
MVADINTDMFLPVIPLKALTLSVANDPVRPAWKQESFFRGYATAGLTAVAAP